MQAAIASFEQRVILQKPALPVTCALLTGSTLVTLFPHISAVVYSLEK